MASKRKLKKDIVHLSASLFEEAVLLRLFANEEQTTKLEELMDDIMVFTDDTLRRAHHTDAPDNPKLVRAYYKHLRSDINKRVEAFDERLTTLLESL